MQYLTFHGTAPGPLFILADEKPLTRQFFATSLSGFLKDAGFPVSNYNTFSFRIGAATTAMSAGIPDVYVKMLGHWKSDCYQLYIKTPRLDLASFSKMLATKGSS